MTMVDFVSHSLFHRDAEAEEVFMTTEMKREALGNEAIKLLSSSQTNRATVLELESLYGEIGLLEKQMGYREGFAAGIRFCMEGAIRR